MIASGARYRRPAIPEIERYEGRGVWYWASPIEARMCVGDEVALVGGGNSAGQAAVYLSGHAAKVNLLIRGDDLGQQHVALPDRPDRGDAEHRALRRQRGRRRSTATPSGTWRGSPGAAASSGERDRAADPQPLPVRRRRSRDELGAALRAEARRARLRADRRGGAGSGARQADARGEPAGRLRDRRRARRGRSSASAAPSARARRSSPRSTRRSLPPRRPERVVREAASASRLAPGPGPAGAPGARRGAAWCCSPIAATGRASGSS